jgi:hypothetical protein
MTTGVSCEQLSAASLELRTGVTFEVNNASSGDEWQSPRRIRPLKAVRLEDV